MCKWIYQKIAKTGANDTANYYDYVAHYYIRLYILARPFKRTPPPGGYDASLLLDLCL